MKNGKKPWTRREFLETSLGAALGGAILTRSGLEQDSPISESKSRVVLIRDKSAVDSRWIVDTAVLKNMLDSSLVRLTGKTTPTEAWRTLVPSESVVGLVPTLHLNPTHQELVDAVRNGLKESGMPDNRLLHAQGGPEKAKACTALVALPALKAHWLTGIGTVLKNYIMYSGEPSRYHERENVKLGEIWNLPFVKGKTKLMVVDALVPLCDKGPQPDPRYKWPYGGLILGQDPVAVETVCLQIIMERRKQLRGEPWPISPPPLCVEAADRVYKLGTSRMERIELITMGWKEDLLLG